MESSHKYQIEVSVDIAHFRVIHINIICLFTLSKQYKILPYKSIPLTMAESFKAKVAYKVR